MKNKFLSKIKTLNLILIFLLFVFTIFQIGTFTNQVYSLMRAEKKMKDLLRENQILEEKLLSSNSLSKLEDFVKKENLVKGSKVKFIQIFEGAVLAK